LPNFKTYLLTQTQKPGFEFQHSARLRESRTEHTICQGSPPRHYTCTPADESPSISYASCLFQVQLAMHLILSVKSSRIEFTGRPELVYYCTCQRVPKENLQVTSHKPIIWRIRGLGTPKDLLGVGVSRNAPWEHHLLGGAVKHTQKHTQKTQLSSLARHLRPSN
jgi:hypothetical protein